MPWRGGGDAAGEAVPSSSGGVDRLVLGPEGAAALGSLADFLKAVRELPRAEVCDMMLRSTDKWLAATQRRGREAEAEVRRRRQEVRDINRQLEQYERRLAPLRAAVVDKEGKRFALEATLKESKAGWAGYVSRGAGAARRCAGRGD